MNILSYILEKDLTPIYSSIKNRVGIYINSKGRKVVIKKASLGKEKLNAKFINNEALILEELSRIAPEEKLFPRFIELVEEKKELCLVIELRDGKGLDKKNNEIIIYAIKKTFACLQILSEKVNKNKNNKIPIRHPFLFLVNFIPIFLKVLLKDYRNTVLYFKMAVSFLF